MFQAVIYNVVPVKDSDKWCQNTTILAANRKWPKTEQEMVTLTT